MAVVGASETKRFKLDASYLIGLRRVSYRSIRAVLQALPGDLRKACNADNVETDLKKAANAIFDDELRTTIELPLADGTTFTWNLARPQAVLRKFAAKSPALQRVLGAIAVGNSFRNPLSIVHYNDEVTSGNLLAPVRGRSFTAFRFSFMEFGKLLAAQQFWFEYAILRSSVLDEVVGGESFVQRKLQHLFFTRTESFQLVGVHLALGTGTKVIFARNTNLIADMAAASACLDLKSASGLKPCVKCANGVKKGVLSDAAHPVPNPDNHLVEITTATLRDFVPNTNKALWENVDELRRMKNSVRKKKMTKASFELAEMACGLIFNSDGLIADAKLRRYFKPVDMHTEDWAHVYLCKGVGGDELAHLMGRLREFGIKYDILREELKLWKWPKVHHGTGKGTWRLFSETRAAAAQKEDGSWKSSASEMLTIAPIILDWICRNMNTQMPGEVESFRRFCEVIDYIQGLKRQIHRDVPKLQRLVERHLQQHWLVYGNDHWTPKWHATLHLQEQITRDKGIVLDTMANERDHQVAKSYGDIMKNLGFFDEHVLKRSLAYQINELEHFEERPSLVETAIWNEDLGATTASKMSIEGVHIAVGDFVRTPAGEVLEVKLCGLADDDLFLITDACEKRSEATAGSIDVRRKLDLTLVWVRRWTDVALIRCWKPFIDSEGEDALRMLV